ncbi:hypothetical protein D7B24_002698 [Verticillium nonalfalfae]|uniref:TAFII55 protein conserved region domain-containing protein n=1 Tax=Verticillium nonalfalfae TaxID=1051616 RepID=A0A3M9YJX2_9PEZI|nr:uncharacterized protein D7B24_002698 [Verticillium nonalfalfae]RNJ59320.1 hypothetical protein D7B24_002698 [Verticillium nonalfalfae]
MSGISAPPPRPKLKLSVSRAASFSDANATKAPQSAATPLATPKIRLKASQPPTPASAAPKPTNAKTKAGRQTKPTNKLIESKKREQYEIDDEDDPITGQPAKRIKLLKTPNSALPRTSSGLILKSRGKPPNHPPGDGYDSEASDREIDPTIEEQFVLRMLPGEHCDYIRRCMEEGKIGMPRSQGGADLAIKWLEDEARRAVVQVKGQLYAAVMLELPTITEGMKTWDRKTFMKSADICNMLLVFQKVASEDEARKAPLPPMVQPGFKWPHGLTPPMHDAVNQRFAKVIERSEIELKEAEVRKLLQADAAAVSSRYEFMDDRQMHSEDEGDEDAGYSDEEDADGEADDSGYFPASGYAGGAMVEDDDDDMAADLEAALEMEMMNDDEPEGQTPATQLDGVTPGTMNSGTPAGRAQESANEEEEEEEVSDEDDDSDVDNEEQTRIKGVREDIAALKKSIAQTEAELAQNAGNKILSRRIESRLRNLKAELGVKLSSLPPEDEEEEEEE